MPKSETSHLISPFNHLIQRIADTHRVEITSITKAKTPHQGASGGDIHQYAVIYITSDTNKTHSVQLISKDAILLERRVVHILTKQNQAIPPAYAQDITTDERQPIYMQYARSRSLPDISGALSSPMTRQIATRLARIHAVNRTQCPTWLPKVSDNVMTELYLQETQIVWERLLKDNRFYAEYGHFDKPLQTALEAFLKLNQHLTDAEDTLTLLNCDFHPDHIRLLPDDSPVFIDWEQACYGSFYLDLVNYFSIETVLLYRDALAEQGYEIPATEFMETFREAGRYMGLRYFEVGLLQWEAGGKSWQQGRWFLHYYLTLALRGQ